MIKISDLSFRYKKNSPLFTNLDLELKPGNIYGLLGKNGAGKTTLLKIMSGMIYAESGECTLNGIKTDKRLPKTYQDIFFIPEEFELPKISVEKFVDIHALFYPKFDFKKFHGYLKEFGISFNSKLKHLSYGQRKMVIISFGLASNTKYLVLDEPSNALDIPSKALLRKMLAGEITDERSFIISTHQIRDLENLIDPIIILNEGKIVFHYSCDTIMQRLAFYSQAENDASDLLYVEEKIDGKSAIGINSSDAYSKLNMELLFNGVLHKPEAINNALTLKQ